LEENHFFEQTFCPFAYRDNAEEGHDAEGERVALEGELAVAAHPSIQLFGEPLDMEKQVELVPGARFFHILIVYQ
jgi:hypothetical protein